jgi:hypothetical protein
VASIGDLVVNLRANTAPFKKGLRGAGSSITGLASKIAGIGGALVGVAGVAGFGAMVKSSLSSIDATAKLSRQIGASTEDLSALGFAAEQSGASQDVLNSALLKMSRRVGFFAKGSGAAKRALDELGFSADDLTSLSAGDQFRKITEEIGKVPDVASRGALAFEIFGAAGQSLLGLIDEGPEGLAKLTDEAERLGITFSAIDAAKVEQANDAMNRVKRAVGGVSQELAIGLAPMLEDIASFVTTTVVPQFRKIPEVISDLTFAFNNFSDLAKLAILDIVSLGLAAFPELEKPIEQVVAFYIGAFSGWKAFFSSIIQNMIGGLKELQNVAMAVVAGISASFAALKAGDFTKVSSAFGDAFFSTLESQKDVEAPNAFAEFSKSFQEGRNKTLKNFTKSGGLTGFIDEERQRILAEIAKRDAALTGAAGVSADKFKGFEDSSIADVAAVAAVDAGQKGSQFGALEAGSKEAFSAIVNASRGGKKPEEKTAKSTEKTAKNTEKAAEELAELNRKFMTGDRLVVIESLA